MPQILALIVGINEYADPRIELEGCVNDAERFEAYLQSFAEQNELTLSVKTLKNKEATRQAIVRGFEHFRPASDGDMCVFFYAGHGSRWSAPDVFSHLEADGMHETIVCWDSVNEGGRDLMDKELSYLIWKVTEGKDIHFLAVTDCCNSGSNTRLARVNVRRTPPTYQKIPLEEYEGFAFYKQVEENRFSPPVGRHVHLAASRADETAKEIYVRGEAHGAFTYTMLEVLTSANGNITYDELISRLRIRLRNAVEDQSPQLGVISSGDANLLFLSGDKQTTQSYLIGYELATDAWYVNAGIWQGINAGDAGMKTLFKINDDGFEVEVTEVFANRAKVAGMDVYNKRKSYSATLSQLATPRFQIAFAPGSDEEGMNTLQTLIKGKKSDLYELTETPEQARYLIHAEHFNYFLTTPYNERPLFAYVKGYEPEAGVDFLNRLEKVSKWLQLLEVSNPATQIRDEEISIELYQITDPGNLEDNAPKQWVNWRDPVEFSYQKKNNTLYQPAFQLKIKNTGLRAFWISVLYMSNDFGITNQILAKEYLGPGTEKWAADVYNGYPYRSLPLQLEDHYHEWGITGIREYLKVLITTDELSTDNLNQAGLPPQRPAKPVRGLGLRSKIASSDWTSKEIALDITRLLPHRLLNGGDSLDWPGVSITAPAGFQAAVSLCTLHQATTHMKAPLNWQLSDGQQLRPFELGPWQSRPGLYAITCTDIQNPEVISVEAPLGIDIKAAGQAAGELFALGAEPNTGRLFRLGSRREANHLLIEELPLEYDSPEGKRVIIFIGESV